MLLIMGCSFDGVRLAQAVQRSHQHLVFQDGTEGQVAEDAGDGGERGPRGQLEMGSGIAGNHEGESTVEHIPPKEEDAAEECQT